MCLHFRINSTRTRCSNYASTPRSNGRTTSPSRSPSPIGTHSSSTRAYGCPLATTASPSPPATQGSPSSAPRLTRSPSSSSPPPPIPSSITEDSWQHLLVESIQQVPLRHHRERAQLYRDQAGVTGEL
ncbi:hypothetical protein MUK42_18178 [Musa troglodytarum]|uniref:Uncharacterized protein n=1 Tax=Musa troglodytarum TaxID=320322 RepID=A0A9E7HVK3_9LILI|nr:hypothetical protein MUK42_18178 [Musa troglodytarum]